MPELETTDELIDQIADWCGIYGTCVTPGEHCGNGKITCCRQGFAMEMKARIYTAVKNDKILKTALEESKEVGDGN